MPLPKIDTPIYDLELPLSKKKIKFRPFLVKEQKNLLMAMESNDSKSVETNIKQILENCTVKGNIDIEKLPVLDVEYYFLQLRARSVGEIVENKYRCTNEIVTAENENKICGNIMETQIDILNIKIENLKENADEIPLTNNIVVKLKYPEFSILSRLNELSNPTDIAFEMIADSIEYIYDGEQFYYAKETTKEEMLEFIEQLNQSQFEKIENFFSNLPKMKKKIEMTCSRCGFIHNMEVEGLENFFVF